MATIHISETHATQDFKALMEHVRAGSEVIIESDVRPIAILRPIKPPCRTISETMALSKAYAKELGYTPLMDEDFAADMREIIGKRKARNVLFVPD